MAAPSRAVLLPLGLIACALLHPLRAARADAGVKQLSPEAYVAEIGQMRALVESCRVSKEECDPARVDEEIRVDQKGRQVTVRRAWLQAALAEAKTDQDADRAVLMGQAEQRLADDAAELTATEEALPDDRGARLRANAILARKEFQTVEEPGWWARTKARLGGWLSRWLHKAFSGLPHAGWLVPMVEWGLLALAALALMYWAWRTMQTQQLLLAAPVAGAPLWQKESEDWARRAQEQASRGDWREAVHCLYWAAIVMLEGRRMWRANRARTPREYLPLLEAGSARQHALGALTRIFERIWYGLRQASASDFEQAQALLEELKAA